MANTIEVIWNFAPFKILRPMLELSLPYGKPGPAYLLKQQLHIENLDSSSGIHL